MNETRVDPTYAWSLALLPVAGIALAYLLIAGSTSWDAAQIGLAVASIALAVLDSRRLRESGVDVSSAWVWLTPGAYLIARTRGARSTPALPVVWVAATALLIVGMFTFLAAYSVSSEQLEAEIDLAAANQGIFGTTSCPEDLEGRVGETTHCTFSAEGQVAQVEVTITKGGGIEWHVIG